MIELIFLIPFVIGVIVFFLPKNMGRVLLIGTGALHLILSLYLWNVRPRAIFDGYFAITPEGLLSLLVISFLFFVVSIYSTSYLKEIELQAENVFTGFMLLFLSTMTMVTVSDHIMVFWIAIEATTLTSAPLIYTHRSSASLEATWKYVLICSVGIAMALIGSILIAFSIDASDIKTILSFSELIRIAGKLNPIWLKAGFIFILVGYGTKMGLAPMHTWLPDAHSEAPSPASAILSGALLNCAYLGIFKTMKIMNSANLGLFSGTIMMVFGLISIVAAATFIIRQNEYKRMLAYSSIENMGIIAFGTGVGGIGVYGAMICMIHHSLIKSSLFLCAGNILLGYGDRFIKNIGRLIDRMPKTFNAFFAGFIGISGFPPFGVFIGEFSIILGAFRSKHYGMAGIFILSLCIIFAGLSHQVMRISFSQSEKKIRLKEKASLLWPQYVLLLTSIALSCFIPQSLYQTLMDAINGINGGF